MKLVSDPRQLRGRQIAETHHVTKTRRGWSVPSQSQAGTYEVISPYGEPECECTDFELRQEPCKHIWAVRYAITEDLEIEVSEKKPTYSQDWPAYNLAQQREKQYFLELLADLVQTIKQPRYEFGRPKLLRKDMVYAMIYKIYSGFSGRRFTSDIKQSVKQGHIEQAPHYNSLYNYFQDEELTEVLADLIKITATPLKAIEQDFAVDSTGFGTSKYQRWFSYKHGREVRKKRWIKVHFVVGTTTNIITAARITTEVDADSPQMRKLLEDTAQVFEMKEVSADKAYLSIDNLKTIEEHGATPYIPFKSNNNESGNGKLWRKMYHYFHLQREEFLQHYHKRSNVETAVQMIKAKFGDQVRSKKWTSQVNEALCKLVAHNICVLVQEMHERRIKPSFFQN